MSKEKKAVEAEEISSPMGSLEQIKTIHEAPLPNGETPIRQRIMPLYLTNYSVEDIGLKWDGQEYIYKARTRAPVQIGGLKENNHVRKVWAVKLATREYYRDNPPMVGGKSKLPSDKQLTSYVQRALEEAPIGEAELGEETNLDQSVSWDERTQSYVPKKYHILKPTSDFPELSSQQG